MHQLLHHPDAPQDLKRRIQLRSDVSTRSTRATSHGRLQTTRCRLTATKATFPARAIGTWEALPVKVKTCQTKASFRKLFRSVCVQDR